MSYHAESISWEKIQSMPALVVGNMGVALSRTHFPHRVTSYAVA